MNINEKIENSVAEGLLSIKAVFLSPSAPFTWASGIKSPIYCDNRLTLAYPIVRNLIEQSIAQTIKENYQTCEGVMGTSTAGIPHAAIVSEILGMPMGYVRGGAKTHGRQNQIEGFQVEDKKVVVVEDLISTAGSCIEVVDALRDAGAEVLGIVSIFTYELQKGLDRLKEANVKNISLSNFTTLSKVALEKEYITDKEFRMVTAFQKNPQDDSWQNVE